MKVIVYSPRDYDYKPLVNLGHCFFAVGRPDDLRQTGPGEYAYNFIVDGKMIRDPSNRDSTDAGRKIPSSLLKVRPR